MVPEGVHGKAGYGHGYGHSVSTRDEDQSHDSRSILTRATLHEVNCILAHRIDFL